jgi:ABC-type glycerol-3-phosphate transport system substrate-binding protein
MRKVKILLLLLVSVCIVAGCAQKKPGAQTAYQQEAKEGEFWHSHKLSLQVKEKREENFEKNGVEK